MSGNNRTLAKGAIGAFKSALQEMYKVALISDASSDSEENKTGQNVIPEETKNTFRNFDQNSTDEEYFKFVESLRNFPNVTLDTIEDIGDANLKNICKGFKRLQELLEQKLSTDSESWFETKQREMQFPDAYARCQMEVMQLQENIEAEKAKINKRMSEHEVEGRSSERLTFIAEDFRSLLPSYLKENAEEKIEFIERFSDVKLSHLRKNQEESEKKLVEASHKCNRELWEIVEETMKTKDFMEWLTKKYELKMKDYEKERDQIWTSFVKEMSECRELCKKYKEVDADYVKILGEQREKEIQKKRHMAATIIQAHIRGFLVRRRNKKSVDNPVVDQVVQDM